MISLLVAKKEFIRSLKNKKKLVLTFVLPLISIIVAICVNNMMKPSINIGIIENQYTNRQVEEKINDVNGVEVSKANKNSINTDMILAKYVGVVEFKQDNKFEVYCLDQNMKKLIEEAVNQVINSGNISKTESLLSILEEDSLSASQRASGFILITLIITCTMSSVIMLKDKEDKVLFRYSITPNKFSSYILGNYIYNLINTIIQIIVAAAFIYLLKIDMGINLSFFTIIGVIIAIISTSVATLVTLVSNSELQASLLSSSIALIMSLLGGAFLPISKMPYMLKFISNLSITKWIIELTYLMEEGIIYKSSLNIIVITIVLSISMVFISTKIGKKKLKY